MVEQISLEDKALEFWKGHYQRELNKASVNFYETLKEIDNSPNNMSSFETSAVANAMEKFFSTYRTFKETLKKNGSLRPDNAVKTEFLEAFSLYAGASEALYQLNKINLEPASIFQKSNAGIKFSDDSETMFRNLSTLYVSTVKKKVGSGRDLVRITKDYFKWVLESSKIEAKGEKYAGFVAQASQRFIKINDIIINGLNTCDKQDLKSYDFKVGFNDIVGNDELINVLKTSIDKLLMYNPDEGKNVFGTEFPGFAHTLMVWGAPGCGKSSTIEAALNYGTKSANAAGKKLIFKNITNQFKSKYYGEASNNLRDLLMLPSKGDASYVFVLDDIDMIFSSRDDDRVEQAEKANLEAIMNVLEGVTSENKGNYIIISTSNHPLSIDPALKERLSKRTIYASGPQTSKQYSDLFKIKLEKSIAKGHVIVNDWNGIGDLCASYALSGRSIDAIATQASSMVYDVPIPDELKSMKSAQQVSRLDELYSKRSIREDALVSLINGEFKNQKEMKEKEQQDKKKRYVEDRILREDAERTYLSMIGNKD